MRNKHWIWLIITIISIISTFSYISAKTSSNLTRGDIESENPSAFNELLSENIRTTIINADSVKWILIDPWVENDSITVLFGQPLGEVLFSTVVRDSTINIRFSEIITSPDAFRQDSLIKESTFMPDFGGLFMTPSDTVLVAYSLYCDICRFQRNEELIDLNGEIVRKDFIYVLKEIFPKDKFIRNIARKR